ncbi:hypothetical protein Zmor_000106 [Zophobas morio]|uniref:Uncharacterized protein n=1 Tax=Zophobas morio TaxID=2755281 RepID=A0AA38IZF0_9CUCU|nr:hypothetical protein Zmor_000106 [Zophobas morio]
MVFIIERVHRITDVATKLNKKMSIYVMLFAVCGCLLGMSILLYFLMSLKLNFEFELYEYFHASVMVTAGLSTFSAVIFSGQRSEDVVKRLVVFITKKVINFV